MAQMDQEARDRQEKLNQGVEAMYREDFDGAKDTFQELIDEAPNMAEAYARMGEAYFLERKEDPENRRIAVENLNRAIEKDASSYWPHLHPREISTRKPKTTTMPWKNTKRPTGSIRRTPVSSTSWGKCTSGPEVPALSRRLQAGDQHRARSFGGLLQHGGSSSGPEEIQ
jgi:tetratricopeptide (TPR) repeat protein